jgi:XTP/dITP diphosphohydrolase
MSNNATEAFQRLSDILDTLRRECPWDREQTMKSLRYLTIEEVHELSETVVALDDKENNGLMDEKVQSLKKELGDLAMHILFYCKIAEEQGLFTIADVYNTICDKLIARHPFIYDKENYHGESWEQLKMRESDRHGVLDGVPDSLPSLVKAIRMQEKVAGIDKEWKAENGERKEHMTEEEFGDYLFALVDWGRRHGINADDALCRANRRFRQRYDK